MQASARNRASCRRGKPDRNVDLLRQHRKKDQVCRPWGNHRSGSRRFCLLSCSCWRLWTVDHTWQPTARLWGTFGGQLDSQHVSSSDYHLSHNHWLPSEAWNQHAGGILEVVGLVVQSDCCSNPREDSPCRAQHRNHLCCRCKGFLQLVSPFPLQIPLCWHREDEQVQHHGFHTKGGVREKSNLRVKNCLNFRIIGSKSFATELPGSPSQKRHRTNFTFQSFSAAHQSDDPTLDLDLLVWNMPFAGVSSNDFPCLAQGVSGCPWHFTWTFAAL